MENLESGVSSDSATQKFSDNEYKEVKDLLETLPEKCDLKDEIALERSFERFVYITDLYQEQSYLLDCKLEEMLNLLLNYVKSHWLDDPTPLLLDQSFKYMRHLTKIRGHKVILRYLPHEVTDLEPVLKLLEHQSSSKSDIWETRYMLLLWLVLLCKVPFALEKFDLASPEAQKPIKKRLLDVGYPCLSLMDKSREAAALFLAEFVSRPDTTEGYLGNVISDSLESLKSVNPLDISDSIRATGLCSLLAEIFKRTKRESLFPFAKIISDEILQSNLAKAQNILLRKLITKLIQRVGLVFLKPQSMTWRYQRGSRSLAKNLTEGKPVDVEKSNDDVEIVDEDNSYEIPEEVEHVISFLLDMLKDKDTIVRWSAAKGVGRIASRLPKALASEVISNILTYFSSRESDGAWHGACLALAELGRRGYLLPSQLPEVVPAVTRALIYDESRGNYSVGSHVRDAACYLCWSFARAYDPQELLPYVNDVASSLLIVTVFDREINCRRAASAAFQENVGRQRVFPHGIEILTMVDYFAVGNRNLCYRDLSVFVAKFPEYTKTMIDHLINHKIGHWDKEIRQSASLALHNLCAVDENYLRTILPTLIPHCTGSDLFLRHGAILAVGQIVKGLTETSGLPEQAILNEIVQIPTKLVQLHLLKSLGTELIRSALNFFIGDITCSIKSVDISIISVWFDIINENLCNLNEDIRLEAADTICILSNHGSALESTSFRAKAITDYCNLSMRASNEIQRIGAALGLGNLCLNFIDGHVEQITNLLIFGAEIREKDKNWAEARRDCLESLRKIVSSVGLSVTSDKKINSKLFGSIAKIILSSFDDYTIDSRGDVGALVREVAVKSAATVFCLVADTENPSSFYNAELIHTILCKLLQQCCEKIDRTRQIACESVIEILTHQPAIEHIQQKDMLQSIFVESVNRAEIVRWINGKEAFPVLAQLLSCPEYLYHVLLGFVISAGGIGESMAKTATEALVRYVDEIQENVVVLELFVETLLQIFTNYKKVDRVTVPLMKVIDTILTSNYLEAYPNYKNIENLLELTIAETGRSKNQQKINSGLAICCGILQFDQASVSSKALKHVITILTHPYPRARRQAANQLYESLLSYGNLDNHSEQALTLLSETNWDAKLEQLKDTKLEIGRLLKVNL